MNNINIFNDDCFNVLPKIEKRSVDMVLVDLPYGQTSCKWDCLIDLDKMWIELKKCCKKKCIFVFFCTTKFGVSIINSNPRWFKYDLVWEKSKKVGFLSANKMPLRKHELIYVFGNSDDDVNNEYNLELREYSQKILKSIDKTSKQVEKEYGNRRLEHFFYKSSQFSLPTKSNYDKFVKLYDLDKLDYYLTYKEMMDKLDLTNKTYNSQKTEGKPYKVGKRNMGVYGEGKKVDGYENKDGSRHPDSILKYPSHELLYVFGDNTGGKKIYNPQKEKRDKVYIHKGRKSSGVYGGVKSVPMNNGGYYHPSTILKFNNPPKPVHRTQKPVDLCEWLIKSYSNEGDIILDFTMGSGSTGIACKNLKRKFIGIEKDTEIFRIANHRINGEKI